MLRVGTILSGRYEIISAIGSGGMSYVYKAKDVTLKRLVAVKVLKEEYSRDANIVAKFAREAEAAGGLSHPNVVSVYDVGEQFGTYYIIMELVEGFTLKKYIEKKGKLSQHDAVQVTMQVARGLNAAHEQGIIHRDVKPQNIMVSKEGKIKVTDFGIARINDTQISGVNTMGSVHYISPEQARGGVCDERSDIYSLGITLYEMVTGRVPFDGESTVDVALKHIKEPITPPSEYEPDLLPNLEKIILKCTQKKPDYRYRSMVALLDDLKRLLATPYEDFVIMPAISEAGATKIMNREEAEEIRLAAAENDRKDSTDAIAAAAMMSGGSPAPERKKEAPKQQKPVLKKKNSLLTEEELEAEAKAQKTEKILNYIMIGIGMLILILAIAIFFRACGILKKPDKTTAAAPSTTAEPRTTAPSETEKTSTAEETVTTSANVVMPNVIGQEYTAAQKMLEGLGLSVRLESQDNADYPAYTIFKQSYDEGAAIPRGTTVMLWVAVPVDTDVMIPNNIAGMTIADATKALIQAGLQVSEQYENAYNRIERGLVCDTVPGIGQVVQKGTLVKIVISLGPEMGTVPGVLGLSEAEAVDALKKAGFSESRIIVDAEKMYSDTYPDGTVASIYTFDGELKAGDKVPFTTDVYLAISRGATFFVDPAPYLGQSDIEEAIKTLQLMGLVVRTVPEPNSSFPNGQICWLTLEPDSGDVTADHVFNKGDTIYLHFSTQAEPTQPTQPDQPTVTEEETTEEPGPAEPEDTVKIDPNYYQGRSDIDAAAAELEALGLVVHRKGEPLSVFPYGQICWLTTEEFGGDITANTPLPKGSAVWLHYSTKEEAAP